MVAGFGQDHGDGLLLMPQGSSQPSLPAAPGTPDAAFSSAEVRGLVIHDIKEVEGVRQQEEQEDKRDEEIGDEVNGEVEEVTQRAHETWR